MPASTFWPAPELTHSCVAQRPTAELSYIHTADLCTVFFSLFCPLCPLTLGGSLNHRFFPLKPWTSWIEKSASATSYSFKLLSLSLLAVWVFAWPQQSGFPRLLVFHLPFRPPRPPQQWICLAWVSTAGHLLQNHHVQCKIQLNFEVSPLWLQCKNKPSKLLPWQPEPRYSG